MRKYKPKVPKKPRGVRPRTLGDGTIKYDALVTVNGKQKLVGVFDKEADAVAARVAFFKLQANGDDTFVPPETGVLTVAQLGALMGISDEGVKLGRAKDYDVDRWNARVLTAPFAHWPCTQVQRREVQIWIDRMANTPIATGRGKGELPAANTVNQALSLLRRVYKWACMPAQGYCTTNPTDGVSLTNSTATKLGSKRRADVDAYLRDDEVRRLLDAPRSVLPHDARAKFLVCVFSGARPGDVFSLRWERIDWKAETIHFTSAKTSKREKRDYTVHALPQLMQALREWHLHQRRPSFGLVFPSDETGVARYVRGYDAGWADKREKRKGDRAVRVTPGFRTKVGIRRNIPLYSLRHTCACQLLLGSELFTGGRMWSREEVQSQLGHLDSKATERYMRSLGLLGRRAARESKDALRALKRK